MQNKRHSGAGFVAVVIGVVALAAGCGGSSTKATPLPAPAGSSPATVAHAAGSTRAGKSGSTTASTSKPPAPGRTTTTVAAPNGSPAAQLAAVQQELDLAGSSLAGSDNAVSGSDVNQAKTQEGSAP